MSGGEIGTGALGTTLVSYGDFTFSEYTNTRLEATVKYDPMNMHKAYEEHVLTVDSIVPRNYMGYTGESSNDKPIRDIKRLLMRSNETLEIKESGYSHIKVGGTLSDSSFDLLTDYGVRPQSIKIENLGDGETSRIVWVVSWRSKYDPGNAGNYIQKLWYTHETSFDIDERGRLTQVVVVNAELKPEARSSTNKIVGTYAINEFLRSIIGFYHANLLFAKRTWSMNLSADRRFVTLKGTLKQVDSDRLYPYGVENIDITHRTSSDLPKGFQLWSNEITGTITLYPGAAKFGAWIAYRRLFIERFNKGIQTTTERNGYRKVYKIIWPRIQKIEIEDQLFNKLTLRFRITYDLNIDSPGLLFARTGILSDPQEVYNEQQWANDTPGVTEPEYYYGRKVPLRDVDTKLEYRGADTTSAFVIVGQNQHFLFSPASPQQSITQSECPRPEDSWLDYQVALKYINQRNMNRHERYEEVTPLAARSEPPSISSAVSIDYQSETGNQTTSNQIYHVSGPASQMIEVRGFALRFGQPTQIPQISRIGNNKVELIDEEIDHQVLSASSCPLHLTKFVKTYHITGQLQSGRSVLENMDQGISPETYQHG